MSQLIPGISIMAAVGDYFRYPSLLLSLIGSIRIEQLGHGLLEDGARATYIETHETTPCRMCVGNRATPGTMPLVGWLGWPVCSL